VRNGSIKHIFFDIGGVLLNIDPMVSIKYWGKCANLSTKVLKDHFPYAAHEQYETGQISDDEFFQMVKNALPQPNGLIDVNFWEGWDRLILNETKTVELLPILKNSYGIYLLSNTNHRHIQHELEKRFSFQNQVHRTFYSFEMGCRKPEKEIFLKALKNINTNPEECLFIDDMETNVTQAKSLGFHTIHFTGFNNLTTELYQIGITL